MREFSIFNLIQNILLGVVVVSAPIQKHSSETLFQVSQSLTISNCWIFLMRGYKFFFISKKLADVGFPRLFSHPNSSAFSLYFRSILASIFFISLFILFFSWDNIRGTWQILENFAEVNSQSGCYIKHTLLILHFFPQAKKKRCNKYL